MKSRFLDSAVELIKVRDHGNESSYKLGLTFVDPFGRDRKHYTMVDLPRSVVVQSRASFTALSSANVRVGIVERVNDLEVHVLLFDESRVVIGNRHEPEFVTGDNVTVVERMDPTNIDRMMTLAALPHPLGMAGELLCLQSVNADILDGSGNLIYRMSADPLFVRGCHDAAVEA